MRRSALSWVDEQWSWWCQAEGSWSKREQYYCYLLLFLSSHRELVELESWRCFQLPAELISSFWRRPMGTSLPHVLQGTAFPPPELDDSPWWWWCWCWCWCSCCCFDNICRPAPPDGGGPFWPLLPPAPALPLAPGPRDCLPEEPPAEDWLAEPLPPAPELPPPPPPPPPLPTRTFICRTSSRIIWRIVRRNWFRDSLDLFWRRQNHRK